MKKRYYTKHKALIKRILQHSFLLSLIVILCSHDLYVKLDTYFLKINQEATINLYNGTFEKSENIITRDRMLDASLLFNGKRLQIDTTQWQDQDSTITKFAFAPFEMGTYVAGVSTKARNIELTAEKFNNYLKHDGVLDMLEYRKKNNQLDKDAIESYQKHVKAIFQVGKEKTDDWKTVLGYPIEFIPLTNPYGKYTGDKIEVKLLLNGKPLSNQLVYSNHIHGKHHHDHGHDHQKHEYKHDNHDHTHDSKENEEHTHTDGDELRTNADGIVTVDLKHDGIYYLRTIYMENVTDNTELTHQSKWATLTFEVTHNHENHAHDNHNDEAGLPTWIFILGSVIIIGVLFIVFRNKN